MRFKSMLEMSNTITIMDASKQHLTPFVKWAGGKTSVTPHLLRHVPLRLTNYFEPFLGGGALFLALRGRTSEFKASLSDTNKDLINAYKMVRDKPEDLIDHLAEFQHEYDQTEDKSEYYYEKRSWRPSDPVSLAARFIFLNKTCYNGLYRVNAKGEFNVPFGRYKNPRFYNATNLRSISAVLKDTRASLEVLDYRSATRKCGKGDFVYLDPPYHPITKTASFTDYTPGGFSEKDQVELAKMFKELIERGCAVLLSNSNSPLIHELYDSYMQEVINVNRSINSVGTGRKGFNELIVYDHSLGSTKNSQRQHRLD